MHTTTADCVSFDVIILSCTRFMFRVMVYTRSYGVFRCVVAETPGRNARAGRKRGENEFNKPVGSCVAHRLRTKPITCWINNKKLKYTPHLCYDFDDGPWRLFGSINHVRFYEGTSRRLIIHSNSDIHASTRRVVSFFFFLKHTPLSVSNIDARSYYWYYYYYCCCLFLLPRMCIRFTE